MRCRKPAVSTATGRERRTGDVAAERAVRRYDEDVPQRTIRVRLTNFGDRERTAGGANLTPRSVEVEAAVDPAEVRSVIPAAVAAQLGLAVSPSWMTTVVDGRRVPKQVAHGIMFEILDRATQEEAIVAGDTVRIGRTTLAGMDLLFDPATQSVGANPAHPNGPEWAVRHRREEGGGQPLR